jgi:hypothetical protein
MHFDESAADLPPKRADEPADLRREIVDELADHLICAQKREQLAGGQQSPEAVQRRVLDRFGDPVAVARKLWFDWMWEKIMTQRIVIAVSLLVAVVSCVALAMAWTSLSRQSAMIAYWQETSQMQMKEQQKLFERLLADSQKKAPSDWNPVEIKFVEGNKDGPPVEGVKVNFEISTPDTGIPPWYAVSGPEGTVRFDRVRYGNYKLSITTPSKEYKWMQITLHPGEGLSKTIVCPKEPPQPENLVTRIQWPDDLENESLWFQFGSSDAIRRTDDGGTWRYSSGLFLQPSNGGALVEPDGTVHDIRYELPQRTLLSSARGRGRGASDRDRNHLPVVTYSTEAIGDTAELKWPGRHYVIESIDVLRKASGTTADNLLRFRSEHLFFAIACEAADWSYRYEAGDVDKPGTLWLTPTNEAVEKVRAALTEIEEARQATKKTGAESQARPRASTPDPQKAASEPQKEQSDTDE